MHYGVGVVPARPYKPRDKAKVESGVLLAERWIIAALRHRKFFSLEELNQAIRELRDRINQRPFRKREGSRASQFAAARQACAESAARRAVRSQPMVSCPSQHRLSHRFRHELLQRALQPGAGTGGSTLDADDRSRSSTRASAWLHICAHAAMGTPSRIAEHRPRSHQAHLEWTPSRMVHWARDHRPTHRAAVRTHPGRQAASGDGLSRSAWASFGWPSSTQPARMEAAAERALLTGACRYQSVKSILKNCSRPAAARTPTLPPRPPPPHDNIRGAEYFE